MAQWEDVRVLATVKAYPQIGDIGESVCVAGINLDAQRWIRLYPLPFRDLPKERQFEKYATLQLRVRKSSADARPESYVPNIDTIEVIAPPLPAGIWIKRREVLQPFVRTSMCEILRDQAMTQTSLGMFQPAELIDLVVEERIERDWSPEKQARIDQGRMLIPEKTPLEKIPYRFKYRYRCGESECHGHEQTIVDWEISQAFRDWRKRYGEAGLLDRICQRWTEELWKGRDTHLFVGNQLAHPKAFLVIGVFWPPARGDEPPAQERAEQLPLL